MTEAAPTELVASFAPDEPVEPIIEPAVPETEVEPEAVPDVETGVETVESVEPTAVTETGEETGGAE